MKVHQSKYLSALLDGQLGGLRRWRVVRHVRVCPTCAAEYRKQRHVRRLLRANPAPATMDDAPEFFWSKVKAEIERRGDEVVATPYPRLSWRDRLSQHQAAWATVTVLLVALLAGFWTWRPPRPIAGKAPVAAAKPLAVVERVTTSLPDTVATPIQSKEAGMTVIWVSGLPWTPNMTVMKTLYASLDS